MDNAQIGALVRLKARRIQTAPALFNEHSEEVKAAEFAEVPGRGLPRVGRVKRIRRALSGDGRREVENVHVEFPAFAVRGRTLPAVVEVHEASALEAAE